MDTPAFSRVISHFLFLFLLISNFPQIQGALLLFLEAAPAMRRKRVSSEKKIRKRSNSEKCTGFSLQSMTPGWKKGEILRIVNYKNVSLQRCFSIVETPVMRSNSSEHLVVGGCDSGPLTFLGQTY